MSSKCLALEPVNPNIYTHIQSFLVLIQTFTMNHFIHQRYIANVEQLAYIKYSRLDLRNSEQREGLKYHIAV